MGPWLHGDRIITHSGNAEFGAQAALDGAIAPDWLTCRLDWFSRHLCAETPEQDGRREVSVFIMGGGIRDSPRHLPPVENTVISTTHCRM